MWTNNSAAIAIPEAQVSATAAPVLVFKPFDATQYEPMVKPVPSIPTIDALVTQSEKTIEVEREEDRADIKRNFRSILNNRLLNESARVKAGSELAKIHDNEEIAELRAEVKRLTEIIEANAEDESSLPPHLRSR